MDWDIFISHAWEDKESFARPLAEALRAKGLRVWFDEFTLSVGDHLRRSIDHGLASSRYGIVILSPHFFAKEWPQKELDGLIAREVSGEKVILPVWHNITADQVRRHSLVLADRIAVLSDRGLDSVVAELIRVVGPWRTIIGRDGKDYVHIPAGEFIMGSDDSDSDGPAHKVFVPDFYISRTPVTNAEYKQFLDVNPAYPVPFYDFDSFRPYNWNRRTRSYRKGRGNHPVVIVSWGNALEYARWAGGRLPTEAEWEKAASWDDLKKQKRLYPWGDNLDRNKCNIKESGIGGTTPVDCYPDGASPYGVLDMAGNVQEWCSSLWWAYPYRSDDGREYLTIHGDRVVRGGCWDEGMDLIPCTCANRSAIIPAQIADDIGFRVVLPFDSEVGSGV